MERIQFHILLSSSAGLDMEGAKASIVPVLGEPATQQRDRRAMVYLHHSEEAGGKCVMELEKKKG